MRAHRISDNPLADPKNARIAVTCTNTNTRTTPRERVREPEPEGQDMSCLSCPTYFGGPLDGRPAARVRGRWPTFRDEHGAAIPTRQGDALLAHEPTLPLDAKRAYLLDDDTRTYVWVAQLGRLASPTDREDTMTDPDTCNTLAAIALCRHANHEDGAAMRAILDDPATDVRGVPASLAGFLVLMMRDQLDGAAAVDAELADHLAAVAAGSTP